MTSLNAVHTQGAIGVQWQSADGKVTMTTEQLIFQFLYAECLGKDDVIQMDKDKLAETTTDLQDLAALLGKVESAKIEAEKLKKDGLSNVVSEVLSEDEIRQVNALIKNLGLTTLFTGTGLMPGAPPARTMQTQALEAVMYDKDYAVVTLQEAQAVGWSGKCGVPTGSEVAVFTPPLTPTQITAMAARMCPSDVTGALTVKVPGELESKRNWLQGAYAAKINEIAGPYIVPGGIDAKTLVRDLTYAVTMINSETAAKNTQQQGVLTDTSNDISKKGAVLDGMKSFVDTMTRTRSGTIQQV